MAIKFHAANLPCLEFAAWYANCHRAIGRKRFALYEIGRFSPKKRAADLTSTALSLLISSFELRGPFPWSIGAVLPPWTTRNYICFAPPGLGKRWPYILTDIRGLQKSLSKRASAHTSWGRLFFELLGNACLLCCSLKLASILIPHQHFSLFLPNQASVCFSREGIIEPLFHQMLFLKVLM